MYAVCKVLRVESEINGYLSSHLEMSKDMGIYEFSHI